MSRTLGHKTSPDGGLVEEPPLERHYIADWRAFRKMTLRQLAAKVGLTAGRISQIEQGRDPYNQRFIEKCARALQCRVIDLLSRPPPGAAGSDMAQGSYSHATMIRQMADEIAALREASEEINKRVLMLDANVLIMVAQTDQWEDAMQSLLEQAGRLYKKS